MRTVDHAVFAAKLSREIIGIHGPLKALSFWVGNLLPDYSYHTYCKSIGHGFRTARKKLVLAWQSRHLGGETAAFYFRLGVAAHYLCDSFTYPHNPQFKGTLKQHIEYENTMHEHFSDTKPYPQKDVPVFSTPERCMRYLESFHRSYLKQRKMSPERDIGWIFDACKTALLTTFEIPKAYSINIRRILEI